MYALIFLPYSKCSLTILYIKYSAGGIIVIIIILLWKCFHVCPTKTSIFMLDMPKSIEILYDSNSRKWRNETFFVLIICLSTNYKALHLYRMQHFWNIYIQSIEYVLVTECCTSVSSSKAKHFLTLLHHYAPVVNTS